MLTTQPVTVGNPFTGTGSAGFVDFQAIEPDLVNMSRENTAIITSISVDNNSNATVVPAMNCFLMQRGDTPATSLNRITIRRPATDQAGFSQYGCRIPVPRASVAGFPVWVLILLTGNVTTDTSLIVAWEIGPAFNA